MKYTVLAILLLAHFVSFSQANSFPVNTFRSKENKNYWKNKAPRADYWQQDVHYTIDATLDDSMNTITGNSYRLVYWNNSPDDLKELYFHLFQNMAQPGSYYENLNQNNKIPIKYGKYEQQGLGTTTENIQVDGQAVKIESDNTILKAFLNKPLHSGDSVVVTMTFKTYYDNGSMRRRMKFYETFNTKHFDGVYWYPSVCVYDSKFGWTTDQDLDKEFYHDFGTFDVALTFPQEYVLDATGVLLNEKEVLPDSLRAKLDIKNFAKKPFNEAPSIIIPKVPGKTKTWYFHAENVHNFAFTADPLYRIGETAWNGVRVITLAQEPHASKWQQSGWYTAQIIKTYSTDFGMYDWPKIIVADAKDGMEYSMLTLDNGTYPQHQYLLSHEVGHMWFYGMVGSNETYRAFMDEGFTQFLTVWSMDKILGAKRDRIHPNKYVDKYIDSADNRYENLYYPYLNHVTENFDEPINTHSCAFNGAVRHSGNYGLVYYKAGTMLYNLKYVLGDSLFIGAMKHYVQKWKFAHPYPEDFRDAIIEYTHVDLNWFFDEWLETTKYIDYNVKSVKQLSTSGKQHTYALTFERLGRMHMPLKFTILFEDSTKQNYLIPNTWFVPPTKDSVLKKWYGWDLLQPTYTTEIKTISKIKSVIIDPEMLLADINNSNNEWGNKRTNRTWQFDHRVPTAKNWKYRRNYVRPDVWHNGFDGVQLGAHMEGKYFNRYNYHISMWGNTTLGQYVRIPTEQKPQYIAFNAIYNRQLSLISKELYANTQLAYNAGIWKGILGFEKIFRKQDQRNVRYTKLNVYAKYLVNEYNYQPYLLYPSEWGVRNQSTQWVNASLNLSLLRNYTYTKGSGTISIGLRAPFIAGDYNYSQITGEAKNTYAVKKLDLKTRVFAQVGLNDVPLESSLYAAGANQEQMIDNKYTRAIGFVPYDWLNYQNTTNHFQYGGGLNLRGYAGSYCTERITTSTGDSVVYAYNGKSGAAVNLELDFDKYVKLKAKGITKNIHVDMYGFFDAGILNYNVSTKNYWSSVRMDAGLGTAMTLKFTPYDITPLTIRADFPLWINSPVDGTDYADFRWVLSVNRAF